LLTYLRSRPDKQQPLKEDAATEFHQPELPEASDAIIDVQLVIAADDKLGDGVLAATLSIGPKLQQQPQ
jgi:hypothetical protein